MNAAMRRPMAGPMGRPMSGPMGGSMSQGAGGVQEGLMGMHIGNVSDGIADKEKLYGALLEAKLAGADEQKEALKGKRRLNCVPILLAFFLPWLLFLVVYACTAFYLHYVSPTATLLIVGIAAIFCILFAFVARRAWKTKGADGFYLYYLAIAFFVAVVTGFLFGDYNFWTFMHETYDIDHLATYTGVNPSQQTVFGARIPTRGGRFQDAGKVYFSHTMELDNSRAMSFKMGDLYCVAPLVDKNCKSNCGHDFWAVGTNCCSENAADFRCGAYNNKRAKSGVRMVNDGARPFYRLAVLQAEGTYNMVSNHPLFFTLTQDPVGDLRAQKRQGYKRFLIAMIVSFFVSAIALAGTVSKTKVWERY